MDLRVCVCGVTTYTPSKIRSALLISFVASITWMGGAKSCHYCSIVLHFKL